MLWLTLDVLKRKRIKKRRETKGGHLLQWKKSKGMNDSKAEVLLEITMKCTCFFGGAKRYILLQIKTPFQKNQKFFQSLHGADKLELNPEKVK